jgi:hypothetical protein
MEGASVFTNVEDDIDDDAFGPVSGTRGAACVIRQLATQLETAEYTAKALRSSGGNASEHTRAVNLALVTLAAAMSEHEVRGLVHALRRAATAATEMQADHHCEFCRAAIRPWSMTLGESYDEDTVAPLDQHTWDQYGYTLCKSCFLAVHRIRWQAALQL